MASVETVPCPTCGRPVSLAEGACKFDGTPVDSATAIAVASTINPSLKAPVDAESGSLSDAIVGERFGKYVIDEIIGKGGMGSVYRVTHAELGNRFALKIMDARIVGSADAHTRFLREARAAARIDHPNVIRVLDHARHPEFGSYLVMELLSGTPLDQILAKGPLLEEKRAIDIALQICDALGAAHEQGIVHRDLKPANVFLTTHKGVETVKVMDFGVAKVVADATSLLTQPGSVIGTPLYMSPEQWDNAEIDARSDVYSFGVVLYEMLTGRLPIRGAGITEVAKNLATKKVPPPRSIRPDLSEATEAVVMRCLEKAAADRFPSMRAVSDALVVARATVGVAPATPSQRRRPLVVALAAVVLGIVAFGALRVTSSDRPATTGGTPRSELPPSIPGASTPLAASAPSTIVTASDPPPVSSATSVTSAAPPPPSAAASVIAPRVTATIATAQRPSAIPVAPVAKPPGSTKPPPKPRDELFQE